MGAGRRPSEMAADGVSDSFRALAYIGSVKAVRQEYRVYRTAAGDFLVLSPSSRSPSSYYMTLVTAAEVEAVARVVRRKSVTTNSLMEEKEATETFAAKERTALRFELLMTLYALVATGAVEMGRSGRNLVFSPKKPAG